MAVPLQMQMMAGGLNTTLLPQLPTNPVTQQMGTVPAPAQAPSRAPAPYLSPTAYSRPTSEVSAPGVNPMAGMSPGLSGLGSAAGFAAAGPGGAMAGSAVGMTADYLIASYERRKQERQLKKEIARREREAKRLEAKADANMSYDRMRQRGADERTIAAEAFNMEMAKVSARNVQQDRLRQSMSQAKQSSQQQQDQFANRGYL